MKHTIYVNIITGASYNSASKFKKAHYITNDVREFLSDDGTLYVIETIYFSAKESFQKNDF